MKYDVFISYSSKDKNIADAITHGLEERGLRCWIAPRDIKPGKEYAAEIVNAIKNSKIMVLVFSNNSNNSVHVLREVERAVSNGIPIIPFRIEDIFPNESMQYYISAAHWLDAFNLETEEQIEKLYDSIIALLKNSNAVPKTIKKWYQNSPKLISFLSLFLVLIIAVYLIYTNYINPKTTTQIDTPYDVYVYNPKKVENDIIKYAKKGEIDKIKELLSTTNLDLKTISYVTDKDKNTLLHIAVDKNDTNLLNYLIKEGVRINRSNKKKQTPLDLAIKNKNINIIETLLKTGAKLDRDSEFSLPKLIDKKYDYKILELLLKYKTDPNERDYDIDKRALTVAILNKDIKALKLLLKYGANPNYEISDGLTPLHIASSDGSKEIVKLLLDYGANTEVKSKSGFTPISLAKTEEIKRIIKDAKKKQVLKKSLSLINAVKNNNIEQVGKLLKDENIDINFKDKNGDTPLTIALKNNYTGIAKLLLKQKEVNVAINNNLLNKIKDQDILKAIKKKQDTYTKKIMKLFAPYKKEFQVDKIKYYIRLGGDIKKVFKNRDMICRAVRSYIYRSTKYNVKDLDNIKILLNNKATVNVDCGSTASPLYYTIDFSQKRCYPELAKLLLKNGANVNYASRGNRLTPYILMETYRDEHWWRRSKECKELSILFNKYNKRRKSRKLSKTEKLLIQSDSIMNTEIDDDAISREIEMQLNGEDEASLNNLPF